MKKRTLLAILTFLVLAFLTTCNQQECYEMDGAKGAGSVLKETISPNLTQMGTETNSSLSTISQMASIIFFDRTFGENCIWNGQPFGSADIHLYGYYVIDKNDLFIYGSIIGTKGIGGVRSLLLQTKDGGEHWQETLEPILNYSVANMSFTDELNGWALTLWTVESPENINIYRTRDGGKSWFEIARIDVGSIHLGIGMPVEMFFQDDQNGRIVIGFEQTYVFLETTDGGITWKEAERTPLSQYEPASRSDDQGFDQSKWKIEVTGNIPDIYISISRWSSSDMVWISTGVIPEQVEIQNGCVVNP